MGCFKGSFFREGVYFQIAGGYFFMEGRCFQGDFRIKCVIFLSVPLQNYEKRDIFRIRA